VVDQIVADEDASGAVLWALTDNLGTVRDVIDSNGVVKNHLVYDSFGRVVSESNSSVEFRFGYTGRELDEETGLTYYRTRYYDAEVGRFIGEDGIGFGGGDANLYRYVGNSPVNAIDPYGYRFTTPARPPVRSPLYPTVPSGPRQNPYSPYPVPQGYPVPSGYPQKPSNSPGMVHPTCITAPGIPCTPPPQEPQQDFQQFIKDWIDKLREPNPHPSCPAFELDPPWKERDKWPRRCQLEQQVPQPARDLEMCIYKCKNDPASWSTYGFVPKGRKCPKWIDWLPDRMIDPDNLPPGAIP
jgi:RHS repeat-associated protein